jgi:hypothetical protein
MVDGRFCGGFCEFLSQNVVFWMVDRGGFVVKVWLETPAIRPRKYANFCIFFSISCNDQRLTDTTPCGDVSAPTDAPNG